MRVSVIGTGYVGLVSGLCFGSFQHHCTFYDIDNTKLEILRAGNPHFYEPNLAEIFKKVQDHTKFSSSIKDTIANTSISFICVGTPTHEDGSPNLSYVKTAAESIGSELRDKSDYHVVVVKSTVEPSTTSNIIVPILERNSGKKAGVDFGVCMNPEFLREGSAVQDCLNPDRILIGHLGEKEKIILRDFYQSMFPTTNIITTSITTAETIKYAANAFLASLISFSNELSNICETMVGVDVRDVLQGVCFDSRISPFVGGKQYFPGLTNYLQAGCGFGGSCFPKDLRTLIYFAKNRGYNPSLLNSVVDINNKQMSRIVQRAQSKISSFEGKTVAILGVAFKPRTDDIRESPALALMTILLSQNAIVKAHDPRALPNLAQKFGDSVIYATSVSEALQDADACFLVTSWEEYMSLNTTDFDKMKSPFVVDCRNMLERKNFKMHYPGKYMGVGYIE